MQSTRLLLIEDDPVVQTVLFDLFTMYGYQVCAAVTPDDALQMLHGFAPDITLVCGDTRGTFASGWNVAQQLSMWRPDLPLVMLTTNPSVLAEVGVTERGKLFCAGLLKPFDMHELLSSVERAAAQCISEA